MVKYFSCIVLVLTCYLQSKGQEQKDLTIGDTLYFGNCTGPNYTYIDLYTKTRWEDTTLTYNKNTGEGFYEYFFSKGDFDIARLPCTYKGKYCIISAAQMVPREDKTERMVVLATILEDKLVVWLEIEDAFNSGELE